MGQKEEISWRERGKRGGKETEIEREAVSNRESKRSIAKTEERIRPKKEKRRQKGSRLVNMCNEEKKGKKAT